ncbi:enoyl-CoA hydratase family protein [Streptomyces sp. AV19]|uniref:enoyl-CoA hydratase family protein n=1 Tax=Streptomyces sp. AV19 TaxID=2793068 RepID=UPI0018FEDFEC|nr:enoyl-CoA hydratase family protein [Streptomyces sp. AV19]MBH1936011.1 enoyl-CoA hydratase family protein [Streptomyces sp. AV19]MDG4534197.1 enoyl-CoA hydratase family protein [Streptomyces sp. AV19]
MTIVRRTHDDGAVLLTLDSPANRNALSGRLVGELRRALEEAGEDPAVRFVVLGHTGPAFCSGADLTEDPPMAPLELVRLLRTVVELPKPVVARVNGHVRAGGSGLVGACDVAVAGEASSFAFTEARIGVAPAVVSLTLLPRLDPRAVSRYYLTGEVFDAGEAMRIGLVTAPEDALPSVLEGLRAASPQGLAESKALATQAVRAAFARDAERLAALSGRLFGSAEARSRIAAWRR